MLLRSLARLRSACVLPAADWVLERVAQAQDERVHGQLPRRAVDEAERTRRRAAAVAAAWSWMAPRLVKLVVHLALAFVAVRIVLSPVFFVLLGYSAAIVGAALLVMVAPAVPVRIRRTAAVWRLKPQRERLRGTQTTCCICLEDFESADDRDRDRDRDSDDRQRGNVAPALEVKVLVCGHCFHSECIVPWLDVKGCCPVCKQASQ